VFQIKIMHCFSIWNKMTFHLSLNYVKSWRFKLNH
jgi:hypothetical protein